MTGFRPPFVKAILFPPALGIPLLAILLWAGPAWGFTFLTYNVAGNGATDWSTNVAQVQAVGRQVAFLEPDVMTFNEIPAALVWQMTNFVKAFLPGYALATNSGTDGYIRSVIASRFPITRSQSWLAQSSLSKFGYSGTFARDLFEAQIQISNATAPLHVFVAHLKAYEDATSAARRAAEALAISNFFVTTFLPANGAHPYLLAGDMNEDILRPPSTSLKPIQALANPSTGLQITTPTDILYGDDRTISIRSSLTKRFDYILPNALLGANIRASRVYRSDTPPVPAAVMAGDSATASDHLPVWMEFNYPDAPLVLSLSVTNNVMRLSWSGLVGRRYTVKSSINLTTWSSLATNLVATETTVFFTTNLASGGRFWRVSRDP